MFVHDVDPEIYAIYGNEGIGISFTGAITREVFEAGCLTLIRAAQAVIEELGEGEKREEGVKPK